MTQPSQSTEKQADDGTPTDFESALSELEQLVERMEQGELSLESSLEHFERGVQLTRQCQRALENARQRVEMLMNLDDDSSAVPFDGGNDADSDAAEPAGDGDTDGADEL